MLAEKARAGARIQILTAHPHSIWTTALADQLGHEPDENGRTTIDHDHSYLARLPRSCNVELRSYWAERTVSIQRFDDHMLLTQHLHATPGPDAPVLYLQRHGPDGLFDRYLTHLDSILLTASEPRLPEP